MSHPTGTARCALALGIATWLVLPVHADQRAEKLLEDWDQQLSKGKMVSCCIRQQKQISLLQGLIQLEGRLYFMYPDCFRIELNGDENFSAYADGKSICVVDHDLDEVQIYDQDNGSLPQNIDQLVHPLAGRSREDILAANRIEYDRSRQEYLMTPKSPASPITIVRFRVDGLKRLVWARVHLANGDWTETEFSRWRRHERVTRHFFRCQGQTDGAIATDPD